MSGRRYQLRDVRRLPDRAWTGQVFDLACRQVLAEVARTGSGEFTVTVTSPEAEQTLLKLSAEAVDVDSSGPCRDCRACEEGRLCPVIGDPVAGLLAAWMQDWELLLVEGEVRRSGSASNWAFDPAGDQVWDRETRSWR